jgi:type VI secretion system secreted protein VgrG
MPAAEHHVLDLRESIQIEPNVVVTHDYDFLRPKLDLTSRAAITDPAVPLEVYADCRYEEGRDGGRNSASVILAQLRSGVRMFDGVSVCKRLVPGHWFTLTDRDAAAGDGDYVITVVEHRGVVAESIQAGKRTYENRFRCAPRDVAYRPPRPRRALQQVTESAVVVGPAGQEIHTDPYGRVKVQFHWDRDGRRNEHSSCWMRVMQPWAGAGWGAQFIPRVGMEVVVSFLGGDVDRPVVMGALYNAANLPPLRLGEKMTQSGIRTQSTPGGGGYNQILFEDSAGGELVAIRAQRNLEEAAMNDLRSTAGRDQAITVGRNASRDVEADDVLHVKGSQTVRVDGALVSQTGGSSSADCSGDRHARVGGDDTVDAGGGHTLQAATFSHVLVGHGNEDGGHGLVLVNGNYRVAAAGELLLSAQQSIRISCGESEILLTPTGVKISAPSVELAVGEKLTCSGKENTITIDDHIEIKGDLVKILAAKASVVLEEEAIVRGAKIKLTSGESTPPPDESDDSPDLGDVIFHLDPSFDPGAKGPLTAIIATPTGEVIEKVADANNDVKVQGRKGDHFVLLGVRCGETTLAKKPA